VSLDSHRVLFLIASFGIPASLVVLNFIVRKTKDWYYTTGSDVLLSLIALNFSSAVVADDVKAYIHSEALRSIAVGIFIMLGIALTGVWILAVQNVELKVYAAIRARRDLSDLQFMIFLCWAAVVIFTAVEMLLFLWR
jgi:hypothetical protein